MVTAGARFLRLIRIGVVITSDDKDLKRITAAQAVRKVGSQNMAPLNEGTLVDAIMIARGQIDFLWQFFVTVHIAVFALLFVYDRAVESLNWIARTLAVMGIAAFEWINGNAISNAYLLIDSLFDQYRMSFGQADRFSPTFYNEFVLQNYAGRSWMVLGTHTIALLVVVLAFASRHFIQAKENSPPRDRLLAPRFDRDA